MSISSDFLLLLVNQRFALSERLSLDKFLKNIVTDSQLTERKTNIQNKLRFRTNLEFDCEYLRNGLRYQKAEKQVINYNASHVVGRKNELWSANK